MFSKILIANRGEIACRVIKTARRMGIKTVAVYSDADVNALHVAMADEAVHIGAAPSSDSYLRGDTIIAAALKFGAQAIHPGYGFLSENAKFAQACANNGLVFIGPPVKAIEAMGSKSAAKTIMQKAGVPLVPGYHGGDQSLATLKAAADDMGYPVLLKAVAGGGGKGMRQVWNADDFAQALSDAKRESQASFGNDDMLVEKYLTQPRHVEVQVFCDSKGNGVYLFERDCSIQRRHQKVIEEAPAPNLTSQLRKQMGEAAVRAAQAIDYQGAGTVEFLLDTDGAFYFMEMNTRLQVEHPVTEMITGQDLVEWQLLVADGGALPQAQADLKMQGHAFEARLYAEDPANDFLPTAGTLTLLKTPQETPHVRVDTGVIEGDEVSPFYDPMIAKLIVWGADRAQALSRLTKALSDYQIGGVTTNLVFLHQLASNPAFRRAELDTGFIEKHSAQLFAPPSDEQWGFSAAVVGAYCLLRDTYTDDADPWRAKTAWRLNQPSDYRYRLKVDGIDCEVRLAAQPRAQEWQITVLPLGDSDHHNHNFKISASLQDHCLKIQSEAHRISAKVSAVGDGFALYKVDGVTLFKPLGMEFGDHENSHAASAFIAPMNGSVVDILVNEGQSVQKGELVVVMEAMKMQHSIKAPSDGTIKALFCTKGDLVDGGTLLLDFVSSESES